MLLTQGCSRSVSLSLTFVFLIIFVIFIENFRNYCKNMKKDTFTLGIAAILISTTGCKTKSEKPAVKTDHQKPNIIFVLADDLGYGDLGSYGQDSLLTPNLDQMAKEGMRFTECYAGNTVCCPSRSSLLTGLHPGHARHRANYAPFKGRDFARVAFDKGTKTIAS